MVTEKVYQLQKSLYDRGYFRDDCELMATEDYVPGRYVKYTLSDIERFNIPEYKGAAHYSVSYGILLAMSIENKQIAYFDFDSNQWV